MVIERLITLRSALNPRFQTIAYQHHTTIGGRRHQLETFCPVARLRRALS